MRGVEKPGDLQEAVAGEKQLEEKVPAESQKQTKDKLTKHQQTYVG